MKHEISVILFSLIDASITGDLSLTSEVAGDTLEKEDDRVHKFTYHQDSIKRYKKQLSKNSEMMVENKITEELQETEQTSVS